jgi:hypothetical protein
MKLSHDLVFNNTLIIKLSNSLFFTKTLGIPYMQFNSKFFTLIFYFIKEKTPCFKGGFT